VSRLHHRPFRQLMMEIVSGELPPGHRLEREEDLATRFELSRGVVREVLRGLEERGLIEVRHGVGAFVTPRHRWRTLDPEVLRAVVRAPHSGPRVAELIQLQRLLEGHAVSLAARRIRADAHAADQLRDATRHLRDVLEKPLISVFRPALAEVHRVLVAACGSPLLARQSSELAAVLSSLDGPETVPSLVLAVDAVLNGRPEDARRRIDEHLVALEARLDPRSGRR
jgi:DNA-binding FadR family transcriptional regulator